MLHIIVALLLLLPVHVWTDETTNNPVPALIPDVVNLTEAVEQFHNWFDAGYGQRRKVGLVIAGSGMRLGVVALERIPAESLYLSIPLKLCIYDDTVFKTPVVGPSIQRIIRRSSSRFQPQQLALNLFLIHQRFLAQERSFFASYIRLIPDSHDVPEFYTDAELGLLSGTLIPSKAKAQRIRHREEYAALRELILSEANVFPLHTFTFDNYVWAQGILNTRMIWWDGVPHLVPMLDMINCRQGTNPHRVHSTKRGVSGRADTLAPWTFEAGDQIFENYGQPNPTYFLYHGFTMDPNIHDCVQISTLASGRIGAAQKAAASRFQLTRQEYCITDEFAKWRELLSLARIFVMSDAEVKKLKTPPVEFVSRVNEGKALTLLKKTLNQTLHDIPSEDRFSLIYPDQNTMTFRSQMLRSFVRTQRAILERTISAIEKRIAPLRRSKANVAPPKQPTDEL